MNYLKHYNLLIDRARNRTLDIYTESHHIIPRCMGGVDTSNNLVELTPEEHYVAHQLLVKIYPNNPKLVYSVHVMGVSSSKNKRNTNKMYGWVRRKLSILKTGSVHSEETKQKISRTKLGTIPWNKGLKTGPNPEHSIKMKGRVAWNKGLPMSKEQKEKVSISRKGKGSHHRKHSLETREKISRSKRLTKI